MTTISPRGPLTSSVVILLSYPTYNELSTGYPLAGGTGYLLYKLLREAGLPLETCFTTYVFPRLPSLGNINTEFNLKKKKTNILHSERFRQAWASKSLLVNIEVLKSHLSTIKPKVILAVGELALYTLTGLKGIKMWRGSLLESNLDGVPPTPVITTWSPLSLQKQMQLRSDVKVDLARVKRALEGGSRKPEGEIEFSIAAPSTPHHFPDSSTSEVVLDIETRSSCITWIGFAWHCREKGKTIAHIIPFILANGSYYWPTPELEAEQVHKIRDLLYSNPRTTFIGQNILYDLQYIWRHWGVIPEKVADTMIGHHSLLPSTQKSLAYLASYYCKDYSNWKDTVRQKHTADEGEKAND